MMDEYELRNRLAEAVRENIFKIPRRNREYEMVMQPVLQIGNGIDTQVSVKFELKYKKKVFPCRMLVERDGARVHVSGVGAYLDDLYIKGSPSIVCSEFVKWMKFARNGTINGDYAFMFYYNTPVGFMVRPADKKHSYVFFAKEIEECGLKANRILKLYSASTYNGSEIVCKKMENTYLPIHAFGKGILPVNSLGLEIKRTLIWSMLCKYGIRRKK